MFVADMRMTAATLAMVVIAALTINETNLPPLVGGLFLRIGYLTVLFLCVRREAVTARNDPLPS